MISSCQWPGCEFAPYTEVCLKNMGGKGSKGWVALCRTHRTVWNTIPWPTLQSFAWQKRKRKR